MPVLQKHGRVACGKCFVEGDYSMNYECVHLTPLYVELFYAFASVVALFYVYKLLQWFVWPHIVKHLC